MSTPIYLDNAATSWPKPPAVQRAVYSCLYKAGGNPGHGSHALSDAAAQLVFDCRCALAKAFGASGPERVIFTSNTTHAINLALHGALCQGDHVLCSDVEHNAVYRPLYALKERGVIDFDTFLSPASDAHIGTARIVTDAAAKKRPNTRLMVCSHMSNIVSSVMPLAALGAFCKRHGMLFCVDAAQSAGHLPIDIRQMQIDMLCLPGHKGLYGLQGCGVLILGDNITLRPLMQGGNGVFSLSGEMPDLPPERYEAGTLPTPAIAGLLAGLGEVQARGIPCISAQDRHLYDRARAMLSRFEGVRIYAPHCRGPVLLFSHDRIPADALGAELDRRGICVRSGFHCAALGHGTLKTPDAGAVRLSFGMDNTPSDLDALYSALKDILL
ncbi:MAG: aminotransferase class V-fold PLP-dependent enzyme [Clostridia bacterium]|nr:aminotransferase class V-fold PLP-dependent enzyme [Clostridia bacterium]